MGGINSWLPLGKQPPSKLIPRPNFDVEDMDANFRSLNSIQACRETSLVFEIDMSVYTLLPHDKAITGSSPQLGSFYTSHWKAVKDPCVAEHISSAATRVPVGRHGLHSPKPVCLPACLLVCATAAIAATPASAFAAGFLTVHGLGRGSVLTRKVRRRLNGNARSQRPEFGSLRVIWMAASDERSEPRSDAGRDLGKVRMSAYAA